MVEHLIHLDQDVLLTGPPFCSLEIYLILCPFLPLPHQIPVPDLVPLRVVFSCVSNFLTGIPLMGGNRELRSHSDIDLGQDAPLNCRSGHSVTRYGNLE